MDEGALLCEGDNHCDGNCPMLSLKHRQKMEGSLPVLDNSLHLRQLLDAFDEFVRRNQPSTKTTEIRVSEVDQLHYKRWLIGSKCSSCHW